MGSLLAVPPPSTRSSSRDDELPKTLNQKSAIKLLKKNGWVQAKGGKHVVKMIKEGKRPITLPASHRQDYGPTLRRSILRAAGLLADREAG